MVGRMPVYVWFAPSQVLIILLVVQVALLFSHFSGVGTTTMTTYAITTKAKQTSVSSSNDQAQTTIRFQGFTSSTQTSLEITPKLISVNQKKNENSNGATEISANKTYTTLLLDVISPFCARSGCNYKSFCICDPYCYYFLDCCHTQIEKDFAAAVSTFNTSIVKMLNSRRFEAYQQLNTRYHGRLDQFGCVTETDGTNGIWMIEKCPLTFIGDPLIKDKCENPTGYNFNSIPIDVLLDDRYHVTYKNIYCALCSGENLNKFEFWKVVVNCPDDFNDIITADTPLSDVDRRCDIVYGSKYYDTVRQCNPIIKTFNNHVNIMYDDDRYTNQEYTQLCMSYTMPVSEVLSEQVNGSDIYRNPHCAFLHNITDLKDYYCVFVYHKIVGTLYNSSVHSYEGGGMFTDHISLRVIFDFDVKSGVKLVSTCDQQVSCEVYEAFDCVSSRCRRLYCPESFIPYFGKCISPTDNTTLTNDPLVPLDTSQLAAKTNGSYMVIKIMGSEESLKVLENERVLNVIYDVFEKALNEGTVTYLLTNTNPSYIKYVVKVDADFTTAHKVVKSLYQMKDYYNGLDEVVVQNFETAKFLSCDYSNLAMLIDNGTYSNYPDLASIYFPSINKYLAIKHVRWQITKSTTGMNIDLAISCIPINILVDLNCPFLKVDASESVFNEGTLQISGRTVDKNDYVRFQNDVYVCSSSLDLSLRYVNVFEYSSNYVVLTYITSSVSIACLLVIICVNAIDRKHMNIHSLNIIALSLTVLSIHIMLVVQSSLFEGLACIVYAVVLHFFILNMFAWINAIAFDMAKVFTSPFCITEIRPYRKFLKYVTASVLLPLTFVVTGLSLQFSQLVRYEDYLIKPGYGENGICWLSSGLSIVVYVIAPISSSIVVTVVLFTVSVVAMCRQREDTKKVGKMTLADYLFVYIKLVFILGFTWALGVISAVSHQEWLWVLHVVLNGLQGFSLLICSVVNKRVIRRLQTYIDSGMSNNTRSETLS